jgi:hypothetical protein
VAQIDAPLLNKLGIIFFPQLIFDTSELTRFISRSPKFKTQDEVHVAFSYWDVSATLPQASGGELELGVACEPSEWQLSSLARVCSSSLPQDFISAVEHLYVVDNRSWGRDDNDTESSQWLELFHAFLTAKELYLSREFAPHIALTLQELVGERVAEVLPALQSLFIEGSPGTLQLRIVQESIGQFVAARQLTGNPFAVSRWERSTVHLF